MKGALTPRFVAGALIAGIVVLAGCSGGPAPSDGSGATARAAGSKAGRPGIWRPGKPDTLGPVVAVFGSKRITRHDVDSILATAPADVQQRIRTPEGYRQLLERMIFEETMLRVAEEGNIERDSLYRAELAKATRSVKMRAYYGHRLEALPEPSDSMIKATYDATIDQYHIPARARIRHIQVATQREALDLRRRLVKGGLWDALCKERSQDKLSKDRGGLVGYVSKEADQVPGIGASQDIVNAAFTLKEGEISRPIKGPKSWHLIQSDNIEEARVQPLEDVRARIRTELEGKAAEEFSTALTDSLKSIAGATIFDDSIAVALDPVRSPMEQFKDAQSAINAADRIKLYKKLVEQFPNDSITVQARFMIAFTYAEDIGDYEAAKKAFEDFLSHHPTSELATSARWMLENMDKAPPPMQEDEAPSDSMKTSPGAAGGDKPKGARSTP